MAAGLGFKTFATGDVLTATDTNGYLMQGVLVFASAAARDAAITSPEEGQFAYLKDTNVTTYYTGSAWANLDTTGMTNPMTTTGDTIYSSSGSTPARLGIGSTGQVLTVAGGVPSWATPASGSSFVGCSLGRSAAQTISNNAVNEVLWTTEAIDTDAFHSTVTNTGRLTIPSGKDGKYLIILSLNWTSNSTGVRDIFFKKNGSDYSPSISTTLPALSGGAMTMNLSTIVSLVATDYITANVYQNSGGNLDATSDRTFIYLQYLGA
jgi:hypothetical protein